jgi:hypothetical protein
LADATEWLKEDTNLSVKFRTQTEILSQQSDKTQVIDWLTAFLTDNWHEHTGLWATYYLTSFIYHSKPQAKNLPTTGRFFALLKLTGIPNNHAWFSHEYPIV